MIASARLQLGEMKYCINAQYVVHYLSTVLRRLAAGARGRKGQRRLWLAIYALKDASGWHALMQGLSAARTGCPHCATADQAA